MHDAAGYKAAPHASWSAMSCGREECKYKHLISQSIRVNLSPIIVAYAIVL